MKNKLKELLLDLVTETEETALMQNEFTTSDYQGIMQGLVNKYSGKIKNLKGGENI